jgi:hypothetical protein
MRAGRRASELAAAVGELSEQCDAPLTRACAAHIHARARGDAPGALHASDLFAEIGADRYASEAAAHAAAAFAAEGRQDSARRGLPQPRATT